MHEELIKGLKDWAYGERFHGFIAKANTCIQAADALEALQAENKTLRADRDQWKAVAEASRDDIQPKLRKRIAELEKRLEYVQTIQKDNW